MKTRIVSVSVTAGAGSAAGTIATPPGRYGGAYLTFDDPTAVADLTVTNMGRALTQHAAAPDQFLDELTPTDEKLISGDVVVSLGNGTKAATATVVIFHHFPT